MSSASVSIIRTCAHHGRRIILGLGQGSVILLWAVSGSAQTPGTSTSQTCAQDPTYCSDTGASPSTTTGSGARVRRRAAVRVAAVRVAAVRAEEPVPARRRRSPMPMRRRFPHRRLGWLQLNGSPTLARCVIHSINTATHFCHQSIPIPVGLVGAGGE